MRKSMSVLGLLAVTMCGAPAAKNPTPPPTADGAPVTPRETPVVVALPLVDDMMDPLSGATVVVVHGGAVTIDGVVVDHVDEIASSGATRLDGVFNALKAKREAWSAAHAAQPFPGVVVHRCDKELSMAVVKSVFQTAAYAGYPNASFAVRSRDGAHEGRINVDAFVPGPPRPHDHGAPLRMLHVKVGAPEKYVLDWKDGANIVAEVDVPRAHSSKQQGLADKFTSEWKMNGSHRDPADRELDQLVVHVDDAATFDDFISVVDAAGAPRRDLVRGDGPTSVHAFNVSLVMN